MTFYSKRLLVTLYNFILFKQINIGEFKLNAIRDKLVPYKLVV